MADNTFLLELSQNFLECLEDNDNEFYDITIEAGNDPYVKIFRAHMMILYYRSPYLRRVLSTNKKRNDETLTHIKLPNILPETFHIILRPINKNNKNEEEPMEVKLDDNMKEEAQVSPKIKAPYLTDDNYYNPKNNKKPTNDFIFRRNSKFRLLDSNF
ncbi:16494_t:CDS:2 [Funneliformis geosporum]|nr:16494_t:CDS:2 [Funneliformis geosporum]